MQTPGWEHYEHDADVGIRGRGGTLAEAFSQAALALVAVITDSESVRALNSLTIECEAPDLELLFVDWLNSLIYEMGIRQMVFSRFDITIEGNRLRADVWGETLDKDRHSIGVEVKGATYTDLKVGFEAGQWVVQTVVDV